MRHLTILSIILIFTLSMSACKPGRGLDSTITKTPTNSPTLIFTATSTASPTNTPTITPTPTPTLSFPLLASTPLPPNLSVISLDNFGNLIQLAHWGNGMVEGRAWSPDGKHLAVATTIGIYLYNATNYEQERYINSDSMIRGIAFSPDGEMLASGASDGKVQLWRVFDGKLERTFSGHTDWVMSVAFSPDGKILASGGFDNTIRLWDISNGSLLKIFQPANYALTLVFSQDGQTLAVGGDGGQIWNVSDGKLLTTIKGNFAEINSMALGSDGKALIIGTNNGGIQLYRISDGACLRTIGSGNRRIDSIALSPDGAILTAYFWKYIELWRVSDWMLIKTLDVTNFDDGGQLTFSKTEDTLSLVTFGLKSSVNVWQIPDYTLVKQYSFQYDLMSKVLSPDGKTLAKVSTEGVQLWRVADGISLSTLDHIGSVDWVRFTPDGQNLAASLSNENQSSPKTTLQFWRISDGTLLSTFSIYGNLAGITFSPDGQTLVTGLTDGRIRFWRVSDGELVKELVGHSGSVASLKFSPDGKTLASSSTDQTIRLWQVSDGKQLHVLKVNKPEWGSIAFSPDGNSLASASGFDSVTFWNISDGQLIWSGNIRGVMSIAFSQDGQLFVTTGDSIKVLRLSDGLEVYTRNYAVGDIRYMAFSTDGTLISAISLYDLTMRLWGVLPQISQNLQTIKIHKGSIFDNTYYAIIDHVDVGEHELSVSYVSRGNSDLRLPESSCIVEQPSGMEIQVSGYSSIARQPTNYKGTLIFNMELSPNSTYYFRYACASFYSDAFLFATDGNNPPSIN